MGKGFKGFNGDGAAHKNQKRRGVSIVAMPEGFFENRFPVLSFPNIDCLTANDKDFSLTLEMTIREHQQSLETPNP